MKAKAKKRANRPPEVPCLQFSPTAWAKLLYLRDAGNTEVGGFGVTPSDDLLFVSNIRLVEQDCTEVSVCFEDDSVADFFDRCVDEGRKPEQFARIWVHTHPADCALPSLTDEETFFRVFGRTEWSVMFILARGDQTYARMRFQVGPGGSVELPVESDYGQPFAGSDHEAWQTEYEANVRVAQLPLLADRGTVFGNDQFDPFDDYEYDDWADAWRDYTDKDRVAAMKEDTDDA